MRSGCCCIQSMPATAPASDVKAFESAKQFSLAVGSLPVGLFASAAERRFPGQRPDLFVPAHPPLSILYCLWLN